MNRPLQMQRASGNIITWGRLEELRKKHKSVALVGFSARHRALAPFDSENIEIWGLNRLHQQDWFRRCDRIFQLHPINYLQECVGLSEGDREHYEWLQQEHPFPLYCQKKYPEFPSSVEYPIKKMRVKFGDFYTSTMAYMMALALDEGFDHFVLYGFDMEATTEYKLQRDSAEYFIGLAEGLGHGVFLPQNSSLLKGGNGIYAYETTEVGFRQLLEGRKLQLEIQQKNAMAKYNNLLGKKMKLEELIEKYPDLKPALAGVETEREKAGWLINTVNGGKQEVEEVIKLFDNHYNSLNIELEVESGGENNGKEDTSKESGGAAGDAEQGNKPDGGRGTSGNTGAGKRRLYEDGRSGRAGGSKSDSNDSAGRTSRRAGRDDAPTDREDCRDGENCEVLGRGQDEVCGGDVQPCGENKG